MLGGYSDRAPAQVPACGHSETSINETSIKIEEVRAILDLAEDETSVEWFFLTFIPARGQRDKISVLC
jgi:hypothetical protein